jgi:hypothetical protein
MNRGVSIPGGILSVVLCAILGACGGTTSINGNGGGNGGGGNGGGGGNPPPPAVAMQQGQWEFPVNNGKYLLKRM